VKPDCGEIVSGNNWASIICCSPCDWLSLCRRVRHFIPATGIVRRFFGLLSISQITNFMPIPCQPTAYVTALPAESFFISHCQVLPYAIDAGSYFSFPLVIHAGVIIICDCLDAIIAAASEVYILGHCRISVCQLGLPAVVLGWTTESARLHKQWRRA